LPDDDPLGLLALRDCHIWSEHLDRRGKRDAESQQRHELADAY